MYAKQQMTFRRHGRCYHLLIDSSEALRQAAELDKAHWVATNAPIATVNCDETFARLLDADGNGRITCRELTDAIGWLLGILSDHRGVDRSSDRLELAAINTDSRQGRAIYGAAEKILARTEDAVGNSLTLQQVRQIKAEIEAMPVSEAGVVLPEAAQDDQTRQFIADVASATGGAEHPGGRRGIAAENLAQFLAQAQAMLEWLQAGKLPPGAKKSLILPLGAETPAAWSAISAVRGKIDQYFAQCEAAALDERFIQQMGWTDAELAEQDFDDPSAIERVLRASPLAKATPGRRLDFQGPVNPYYAEPLTELRRKVLAPVLGESPAALAAEQWGQVKAVFADHQAWLEAKPEWPVEIIDEEKLRAYLDGPYADATRALIHQSAAAALELDNVRLVEKLILYQAGLIDLANNFVSFPHLYDPARRAMFEMGTLVIDGRRFNLAVRVDDRAGHAELAEGSNMCVMYVEVACPHLAEKYEVAVPVTAGDKGNLCVGKRGVFYDVAGNECDAKVVHIIANPISIREAMVSPFKRLGKLLTGKIESITAQAEKKLDATASAAMSRTATSRDRPAQPGGGSANLAAGGMLIGASVALAAVGSAIAYVAKTVADAGWLPIVIAVLAAVLLVALPTSIVAFLKLRRRDLSAILEGSGWGINARMRLTRRQRKYFTQQPPYPPKAKGIPRIGRSAVTAAILIALLAVGAWLLHRHHRSSQPSPAGTTRPASASQSADG